MTSTPTIAFLGTGRMGLPMAMNLARAGFPLRIWNRTADRTAPLADAGATLAATPAEAARGADVIITMLTDGAAVQAVMTGADGALTGRWGDAAPREAAGPRDHAGPREDAAGAVWVQMSTVGVTWTGRLAAEAAARGVTFVDAPVSGSAGPARAGELTILASGPSQARETLEPVFAALGRATVWLGEAGAGTRAKLVLNNLLVDQVEATAEALAFARRLELDPAAVVGLLKATPLGSPFAVQKAQAMLAGDFRPAFALKHAIKDAELAVGAAHEGDLVLTEALLPRWRRAALAHADDDLAVVYAEAGTP